MQQQICSLLRPGDIVCIRRTTGSGHAMLYVGNGLLIHSSGSNYSNKNQTDTHEATIRFRAMLDLFDESIAGATSYIFNLESFSIVRPQNNTKAKLSANTANRVNNMEGIIAEKVVSTAMGKTVNCGDEITYTFYIFNTNPTARKMVITDVLSKYTSLVQAEGVSQQGDTLTWELTVLANSRISLSYTVKVNEGLEAYTKIDGALATVNGVTHKCIDTVVANTLTAQQQQALVAAVNTVKAMDVKDLNSVEIANLIYKTAFGVDKIFGDKVTNYAELFNGNGKSNIGIFNDTFYWSDKAFMSLMDSNRSQPAMMVAPGLYGGQNVYTSSQAGETFYRYLSLANHPLRSRYYWEKDLVIGDLYLLRGTSQESLYLYLGADTFVSLGQGHTLFAEVSVAERFGYSPATVWKYHAVLRPSMVLDI